MTSRQVTLGAHFEYTGHWWLPGHSDEAVAGTIRYSGGRLRLDLFDPSLRMAERHSINLLLGALVEGGNCTATGLLHFSSHTTAPGADRDTFAVTQLFIGEHFDHPDGITFDSIAVSYTLLEEWLGEPAFKIATTPDTRATHIPPTPFSTTVASLGAEISLDYDFQSGGHPYHQLVWEHEALLKVRTEVPAPWSWFEPLMYRISDLLTLLIGQPALPRRVFGDREVDSTVLGQTLSIPVGVCFNLPSYRVDASPSALRPLTSRADVPDLGEMFGTWFANLDALDQPARLVAGTLYNPFLYSELQFLALAQACETLHRRRSGGQYLDDEAYEPFKNAMVAAIPQAITGGFREALKGRLKYGNQYSLRKRLTDLIGELAETRDLVTGGDSNFVENVVATRNFYTHYDESSRSDALSGRDLYLASVRLRLLVTITVLKDVHLDEAALATRIAASDLYRAWLAHPPSAS